MYIFLCVTPIYLRTFFIWPQNRDLFEEINTEIYIIEKPRKSIARKCKSISPKTVK